MDRRKTLGALSPGSLNARASLAPGRYAKDGAKAAGWGGKVPLDKAMGRLSLAGPVQRRSSAYTTVKGSGLKSDPRPISDKQFQANCARTIITYLATHNYEYQINPKVLTSPTTKDFNNVMLFLLRQLDPTAAKGPVKMEEEVPALYKRLRYPFQISKSNLTAVGSPHTWPSILAALTWLVELLNYQEQADHAQHESSPESAAEADFFDYVATSYRHFMSGDDALCEEVDGTKAAEFEDRAAAVRAETARLQAANEALAAEAAALRSGPTALERARARLAETRLDREKFGKLIASLESHRASLERKAAERRSDVAAQTAELSGVERECDQLRARLATQTVQPADVQRMAAERAAAETELRAAANGREALEARLVAGERALAAALDAAEAALADYHTRGASLQLVPAAAKRGGGAAFEIALDRAAVLAATGHAAVPNPDWKGSLRPALCALRDRYASRARELAAERLALSERAEAAADAAAEREEEVAAARAGVERLEAQLRAEREALDAEVAAAGAQVATLRAEVAQLRGRHGAAVARSEEAAREAQARLEEATRAAEASNAGLHRDLAAALELVLHHKLRVQERLAWARTRAGKARDEVVALCAAH